MNLRTHLDAELARRRARFAAYSLRAFATSLGIHHSTLLRIRRDQHRLTPRLLERVGARLGLSADAIALAGIEEDAVALLRAVGRRRFRPDSRAIAVASGIPLDRVNIALHHVIHTGRLTMHSPDSWSVNA